MGYGSEGGGAEGRERGGGGGGGVGSGQREVHGEGDDIAIRCLGHRWLLNTGV